MFQRHLSLCLLFAAVGCAPSADSLNGEDPGLADAGGWIPDGAPAPPDAQSPFPDASLILADGAPPLPDAQAAAACTLGAAGAAAWLPLDIMAPGTACGGCHLAAGKPLYISGTVMPTAHEPDLCLGVKDVKIEVVDRDGATHFIPVNAAGNFVNQSIFELWPSPWKVAVVRGSARLPMEATVTNGDCNSCHTATAAEGRILAP